MDYIKENVFVYIIVLFLIASSITTIFFSGGEQQFSYLANSFLNGKTYFLTIPRNVNDAVYLNDHYYWPLGPFPAIILMPFVFIANIFGVFFQQGYLQVFLTFGVLFFAYKLAKQAQFSKKDALLLAFAFCFATPYHLISFSSWSWQYAQSVCTFFLFAAIYEYLYGKKRLFLVSIFMAAAFATRLTTVFGILFFILLEITQKNAPFQMKMKHFLQIIFPYVLVLLLLFVYNFERFGSPFESGYILSSNNLPDQQRFEQLNYGLFQLKNIPTNFYYYFIKSPDPVTLDTISYFGKTYILKSPFIKVSYPGISFFWVAPIFLYCFRANLKKKQVKVALVASGVTLFVLLTYYWPGWRQVGARYFLDFLPFMYLVLLYSFPKHKLSMFAKVLIVGSAFFDLYLLTTIF